jgi:hypothetical protein
LKAMHLFLENAPKHKKNQRIKMQFFALGESYENWHSSLLKQKTIYAVIDRYNTYFSFKFNQYFPGSVIFPMTNTTS